MSLKAEPFLPGAAPTVNPTILPILAVYRFLDYHSGAAEFNSLPTYKGVLFYPLLAYMPHTGRTELIFDPPEG